MACGPSSSAKYLQAFINDEENAFYQHLEDMKCANENSKSLREKAIKEDEKQRSFFKQ